MHDAAATDFTIWRLDATTQDWVNTGTLVDGRVQSRADALWTGSKLYIATAGFMEASTTHGPRIMRYSYNSATKTFTVDSGFPVNLQPGVGQPALGGTESVTIARDTTGMVWVAYTQNDRVWVAHSTTSD